MDLNINAINLLFMLLTSLLVLTMPGSFSILLKIFIIIITVVFIDFICIEVMRLIQQSPIYCCLGYLNHLFQQSHAVVTINGRNFSCFSKHFAFVVILLRIIYLKRYYLLINLNLYSHLNFSWCFMRSLPYFLLK